MPPLSSCTCHNGQCLREPCHLALGIVAWGVVLLRLSLIEGNINSTAGPTESVVDVGVWVTDLAGQGAAGG
jgi:hypothetical protein